MDVGHSSMRLPSSTMRSKTTVCWIDGRRTLVAWLVLMGISYSMARAERGANRGELPDPIEVAAEEETLLGLRRNPLIRGDLKAHGAASCAAAACHGGAHPGVARASASRGAEYPLWFQNDPHARSWQTICGEQSVAMMRRLGIMQGGRIVDQAGFHKCLACHNTTGRMPGTGVTARMAEGVGCAACHGPDQNWLHEHYRDPPDPDTATALGFVDNKDLLTRARMCATCHVGDKDRDMNHDMIAAGHPELQYEFATYHSRLPKHWREDSRCEAIDEAQLWLVGQIASLDASLTLLESRAHSSQATGVWPEFAEYDCASCHHQLRASLERTTGAPQDSPRCSTWHRAGLPWLLEYTRATGEETAHDRRLSLALNELSRLMETGDPAAPSAVARQARTARHALDQWLRGPSGQRERQRWDAQRLKLVVTVAREGTDAHELWVSSAQRYLAEIAGRAAWPDGWHGPTAQQLRQQRHRLLFPSGSP
jgi:hypothetical protein